MSATSDIFRFSLLETTSRCWAEVADGPRKFLIEFDWSFDAPNLLSLQRPDQ